MQELNLSKKTSYEQQTDQPNKVEVYKATAGKRVLAFFLDAIIVALVFVIFQSTIVNPISKKVYNVPAKTAQYQERLLESHLYEPGKLNGEDYDCLSLIDTFDYEKGVAFDHYHEKIMYFYETFKIDDKNKKGDYLIHPSNYINLLRFSYVSSDHDDQILVYNGIEDLPSNPGIKLFDVVVSGEDKLETLKLESITPNSKVSEKSFRYFFEKEAYEKAMQALSMDEKILTLANNLTLIQIGEMITSLTLSSLIFWLIIPLCTKYRQTIGMMSLKIGVVNRANGFVCKRTQILIRFVVMFIFEILLSFLLILIPAIISFTMMVFGKENQSIHDYFSATLVVDKGRGRLYHNEQEFLEDCALQEDRNGRYVNTYISEDVDTNVVSDKASEILAKTVDITGEKEPEELKDEAPKKPKKSRKKKEVKESDESPKENSDN